MKQSELAMSQSLNMDTEFDKQKKKQKLVRNEFLDRRNSSNKYGIPLVRKQAIDLNKIELWGYPKTKHEDYENVHKTIHFFTYDWNFETVYNKAEAALEKLDQYYALLTPDFSVYTDMPLVRQIDSVFKNRWCGAFWQKHGLTVIPTMEWGSPKSYEFCFEGVEQGSVVAVATYGRESHKGEFMEGYNKMLEIIKPSAIICYGEPFKEMRGNIKAISAYNHQEIIKQIGQDEYMKRYLEGTLYPSN